MPNLSPTSMPTQAASLARAQNRFHVTLHIPKPDGSPIRIRESMVYLGGLLHVSGKATAELTRRLGLATADFHALCRVWKHAVLDTSKKVQIFSACVISKLMYSLHTCWFGKADICKLDAFQARCLRQILRIPPSFVSRVTNEHVLRQANCVKLSRVLQQRQLQLLARIAQLPSEDVMRKCVFRNGSFQLTLSSARRRGRPRHTWATEVYRLALDVPGSTPNLIDIWQQPSIVWRRCVQTYCLRTR